MTFLSRAVVLAIAIGIMLPSLAVSQGGAQYVSDMDRYKNFIDTCNQVIAPQFQTSSNILDAIDQMQRIMDKVPSNFEVQSDISLGAATYYYVTNAPLLSGLSYPGAGFNYLTAPNPQSVDYPELRKEALFYRDTYGADVADIFIHTASGGLTQVFLPIRKMQLLENFYTDQKLNLPPSLFPKVFQVAQMGYPQQWTYKFSERRDFFDYFYIYEFPSFAGDPAGARYYGEIRLMFDAKRSQDGVLSDVVMRNIRCQSKSADDILSMKNVPKPPVVK